MKKIFTILCCALLLTGCGSSAAPPPEESVTKEESSADIAITSDANDGTSLQDNIPDEDVFEPVSNEPIGAYHFDDGTSTVSCKDIFEFEVPRDWQVKSDVSGSSRLISPIDPELYMSVVFIPSPNELSSDDESVVLSAEDYLSRFTGNDESGTGFISELDSGTPSATAFSSDSNGTHYCVLYTFINEYQIIYYLKSSSPLTNYLNDASQIMSSIIYVAE